MDLPVLLLLGIILPCLAFQLFFWLLLALPTLKYINEEVKEQEAELPPVSIVIPARNELENLKQHLPHFLKQDYPTYEVVVVDDCSHDGTEDYLLMESIRKKKLNYVRINHSPDHLDSKKYALTLGIRKCAYDRIIFTDADCIPSSNHWLRLTMAQANGKDIVCGAGLYLKEKHAVNPFIRADALIANLLFFVLGKRSLSYTALGRNLSYTRQFFLKNKGFKGFYKHRGGDDDLFVNKYGNQTNTHYFFHKDALTLSKAKTTFGEWRKQKTRHVFASKQYSLASKCWFGAFTISSFLCLVLGIVLTYLLFNVWWSYIPLGIFIFSYSLPVYFFSKKLSHDINVLEVVGYLFLSPIFYLTHNLPALMKRNIIWK